MAGYQYTSNDFAAIKWVESSNNENAVGVGGRAIGPYQIIKAYYEDAVEHDSSLSYITYPDLKGPGSAEKSEKIMQAYSNRYTTKHRLGHDPTFEDAARNHNGGPNGWKSSETLRY